LQDGTVFLNIGPTILFVDVFLVVFFERNGDLIDVEFVDGVNDDFLYELLLTDLQDEDARDLFDDDENESSFAL
jgi:hypothetical protein